jgi:hypothetical protein
MENKKANLALDESLPLELILLTGWAGLQHDEVPVLGEEVGRLKQPVPGTPPWNMSIVVTGHQIRQDTALLTRGKNNMYNFVTLSQYCKMKVLARI